MALQTQRPARSEHTEPGNWLMLAVLLLGQFMCVIDVLVVNAAMPSIAASLHASGASLQLVVGGYTIAYAMLLITGARLGDRYGRRRTYLAGVIVFTTASLACALAPDSQALIAFRLVQGVGAAILVPQVFSIIQLNFTGPARARALSAYAAVLSAGAVAGLVLGGVVVTANLFGTGWRPVFAINVPLGLALAVAVPRLVPADEPHATRRFDGIGLPVAAGAVLLIGLAGYHWRRLPAAARKVLVPAGLAVSAAAYLSLAAGLHRHNGVLTWTGLTMAGLGLGLSVSPLLTQSLTHVPQARAADASGLLTTTVQLGQFLGVAAIGSVYLARAASSGAMAVTACWLAALSAAGLLAAAVMVRAARGGRP